MAKKADPPDDKNLKSSTGSKSGKTEDANIPVPEPDNPPAKTETQALLSHHSSRQRAPKKRAWNYLFEFLMLFLAVFCGFIAENWRERLSEHQREEEYIHSLVEDIKSDTLQSGKILTQLRRINAGIDSVLTLLSSPEIMENSNEAYRLWSKSLGLEVFVSNDRTIQQLKNSGELRLIRNKAVSDRIMEYDQTLRKYYVQSNLMYSALSEMTNYSELFDFIRLDKNENIPVPLTEQGKRSLNRAYANLQLWNKGLVGLISWLKIVDEEGKSLIAFIQEEYHLE